MASSDRWAQRRRDWPCARGYTSLRHQGEQRVQADPLKAEGVRRRARRASVEREFGRLKNEWGLSPLRVRGLDRVRLHADLTILAKLATALSQARVPLPA